MHKITSIKKIDSLVGRAFVLPIARLFRPRTQAGQSFNSFLIIRPGGIGDAVLLIPAIQAIRKKFPSAVIHVLAEERNAEVFSFCPDVERVFRYDRPTELISVIRGSYDVVIDTEQWHRLSAVVARLVRSPMAVGFSTNERKKLFTHQVVYSHNEHEVDSFLHLVEPFAGRIDFDPIRPFLTVPAREVSQVEGELRSLSGRKILAIFPGGSIPERQWGSERFHVVAEQFSRKGYGIVVIGGKEDVNAGAEIVRGVAASLNMCGRLSLTESAAVLSLASLLITGDSGIMHLGYAVGTRALAVFGPGIEKKWAPRSPRVAILNKNLPCSPCTEYGNTPKCRKDVACMKEISAQEVIESALALLEKD